MSLNRAQRRAQKKAAPLAGLPMSQQKLAERWTKNGITERDLDNAFKEGLRVGGAATQQRVIKSLYAAIMLAGNEIYGFGQKRGMRLLNAIDRIVLDRFDTDEMIEEVWQRFKLKIDFKESLDDRITEG